MRTYLVTLGFFISLSIFLMPLTADCQLKTRGDVESIFISAVNEAIQICKNKSTLRKSKSANLRRAAALASMKAAFLLDYKEELVKEMINREIGTKPYQMQHYLNKRFFGIIRPVYARQ